MVAEYVAEEAARRVEEKWRPPPRLFFGDVMLLRIAPTTLARSSAGPIVLKYRKRPGGKKPRLLQICGRLSQVIGYVNIRTR
jgi:hypothetical protein